MPALTRAILGFDTSTAATAAAVLRADGEAAEARDDPAPGARPEHAGRLLGLVSEAMAGAGTGWADIGRVAVGAGPGGFTGLRIGVATARALAQARALPIAPVSSLRALAEGAARAAPPRGGPVLAVIDARRGEVFAAAWRDGAPVLEPRALAPEALAALVAGWDAAPLTAGDGAIRFRSQLEPAGADIPPDGSPAHRVSAIEVCRLGRAGATAALETVVPDYLRAPDAIPRPS